MASTLKLLITASLVFICYKEHWEIGHTTSLVPGHDTKLLPDVLPGSHFLLKAQWSSNYGPFMELLQSNILVNQVFRFTAKNELKEALGDSEKMLLAELLN